MRNLGLVYEETSLNSGEAFSDNDEHHLLAGGAGVVQATSDKDLLTSKGLIELMHFGELTRISELGVGLRAVQLLVTELVSTRVIGVLLELLLSLLGRLLSGSASLLLLLFSIGLRILLLLCNWLSSGINGNWLSGALNGNLLLYLF